MRSVMLGLVALIASWMAGGVAEAQGATAPRVCRLGVFVQSIHDVDTRAHTFAGDFWLWSLCPAGGPDPLETLEVVNAVEVEESLASSEPRGALTWTARKLSGRFRHGFDLSDYPFDRHRLALRLEESDADVREMVFTPDQIGSALDPELKVDGWRVTSFGVSAGQAVYPTTFGDPSLPPGSAAHYARFDVRIGVARAQLSSFFKLVTPLYVAAALALVTFLLQRDSDSIINPRIGLLAGVTFAAVLNMRLVDEAVGAEEGLTLIDTIHISAFVLILGASAAAVVWTRLEARGWSAARIDRWDRRMFAWGGVLFVVVNLLLIGEALLLEPGAAR